METSSSSLAYILGAAGPRSAGVVGNLYLAGGFLIGSSLLGLLVIIGAFWYHRSNLSLFKRSCIMSCSFQENSLKGITLVHNSLVTLLTIDAVNLIVTIILGAGMVGTFCDGRMNCLGIETIWYLTRWVGGIIHLLNASLSISHLCHQPLSVARVRIAYSLIGLLIGIMIPFYVYASKVPIFILGAFMFLFALSVIVTSTASTSSPSTATLKKLIMLVAMCNFLVVYIPTFILKCLIFSSYSFDKLMNYIIADVNVLVFTNLHLIFDGFLCALILKLPSGEEQQQQQQELQQWQPQQLQELIYPNPEFTAPTNVNQ